MVRGCCDCNSVIFLLGKNFIFQLHNNSYVHYILVTVIVDIRCTSAKDLYPVHMSLRPNFLLCINFYYDLI